MGLRVSEDIASKFEKHAASLNQSSSNLLVMLMEALTRAMDKEGHVMMPIIVMTPSDYIKIRLVSDSENKDLGSKKGKISAS